MNSKKFSKKHVWLPRSLTKLIKGSPVTSCIGASAVGHIESVAIPSLVREPEVPRT